MFCCSRKDITQRFDLCEIKPIIKECSAREFSRFGVADEVSADRALGYGLEDCSYDGWSSVDVKFKDVFAGYGFGRREVED